MGETMSSKPKSETQEIEFLNKFKCVEEHRENKTYTIYNCDAYGKVNKDNVRDVIEQALVIAQQFNAVVRLFRIVQYDATHSISITVTRGGLLTIDVRFPQRIGGFQNVLSIRLEEVNVLKQLADKLAEIVQSLIL